MNNKTPPSIQLHIGELVLHGFAPADRHHIADAVQAELTRLFAEQGVSSALRQGGEAGRLRAEPISITPAMPAGAIGTQVARSVYGSLSPNDYDRTRNR
jgi:hypothetical protein